MNAAKLDFAVFIVAWSCQSELTTTNQNIREWIVKFNTEYTFLNKYTEVHATPFTTELEETFTT